MTYIHSMVFNINASKNWAKYCQETEVQKVILNLQIIHLMWNANYWNKLDVNNANKTRICTGTLQINPKCNQVDHSGRRRCCIIPDSSGNPFSKPFNRPASVSPHSARTWCASTSTSALAGMAWKVTTFLTPWRATEKNVCSLTPRQSWSWAFSGEKQHSCMHTVLRQWKLIQQLRFSTLIHFSYLTIKAALP